MTFGVDNKRCISEKLVTHSFILHQGKRHVTVLEFSIKVVNYIYAVNPGF